MAESTSEKVSPDHLLHWWELMYSLRLYYRTSPGAALNRCPTNIFLNAIRQAFEGTGEIEDGTIELEDLIVIIASCIDHVRSLICTLKGLADVQGLILGNLSYSQNQLVMKPSQDGMGGFPRVSTVMPRRIDANQ
jgi:hypothetical protein